MISTLIHKKPNKGFTLIEVMIAMFILAGAIVTLNQAWTGAIVSFQKSQKMTVITNLLEQKIVELELKYKTLSPGEIPESEAGNFGEDHPDLSWTAEVKALEFPDLTPVLATGDNSGESIQMIVRKMTEFFGKSVKELRVTIIWTANQRKLNYSVTTYLVNYKQDINLGIGI